MSESSNFSTVGNTLSNSSIGSIGTSYSKNISRNKKKFRYRVTNVFFDEKGNCTHIEYEDTFQNYGKSLLGSVREIFSKKYKPAYTSNSNIQIIPKKGEYVEIFNAAEEYSAAADKANCNSKSYWKSTEGPLNIWGSFEGDNINLDPTVPGQVTDTQMASLNTVNYTKSLIGMVPKSV